MIFYKKFKPLLELNHSKYDFIVLTGGRGSMKTGHCLRGVLKCCGEEPKRVCFFRETKDTLDDSLKAELHSLIETEFSDMGFTYTKDCIRHENGSYMFFKGLKEVNTASVENLKGVATSTDIFVVDEAQAVSKPVWDVLIPTLRKEGCVLIAIYNRIRNDLPVEQAFFIDYENKKAPENTYFLEVNYPEILHLGLLSKQFVQRAELVKENKPEEYATIYMNQPPDQSQRTVVKYFSSDNITPVQYCPEETLILTMDFNVDPMMWCVCHKDDTNLYQLDEIVIENCTTEDAVAEFINRYPNHKGDIFLCGDASGNYRKTQSNQSDYNIVKNALLRHGYPINRIIQHTRGFNPPIVHRVRAFNKLVFGDDGERRYYVDPKCKWTIYNMKNLMYKEGTSIIDLPTPSKIESNKDLKFIGHIFDAISYPAEYFWPITLENKVEPVKVDPSEQWTMKNIIERQNQERKNKW